MEQRLKNNRNSVPHIDLLEVRTINKAGNQNLYMMFKKLVKDTVELENDSFLNGDSSLIEYLLANNLKIPLKEVCKLERASFKLNYESGLLNMIGEKLTNLQELTLNGSVIKCVSDIGCSYKNLKSLYLRKCKLEDLSGLICFEKLEVVDLAENKIDDLIELEMCSSLRRLDLEENQVEDEDNIYFLAGIHGLEWLRLRGNPISKRTDYNELVENNLPKGLVLDEEYVKIEEPVATPQTNSVWLNQLVPSLRLVCLAIGLNWRKVLSSRLTARLLN